jgi:hypothetical protein
VPGSWLDPRDVLLRLGVPEKDVLSVGFIVEVSPVVSSLVSPCGWSKSFLCISFSSFSLSIVFIIQSLVINGLRIDNNLS